MGTIVVILLVVLGIALLFAIIEALLWLAVLAVVAIAGVIAWRRLTGRTTTRSAPS